MDPMKTTYQMAYDMGYYAYKYGAAIQDNPYESSNPIHALRDAWIAGFIDAREECY